MNDVKALLRVLFLYLPLPIFWALFDQQGSRWTLQATRMNGDLFGVYRIKPDQIQVINPILIVIMIPLFEYGLYPLLKKCNLLTRPLQKITVGGFLAALSFVVAALVQIMIDNQEPQPVAAGHSHLTMVSGTSCTLNFSSSALAFERALPQYAVVTHEFDNVPNATFSVTAPDNCWYKVRPGTFNRPQLQGGNYTLVFVYEGAVTNGQTSLQFRESHNALKKPQSGGADVRLAYNLSTHPDYFFRRKNHTSFTLKNRVSSYELPLESDKSNNTRGPYLTGITDAIEVDPTKGAIQVFLPGEQQSVVDLELDQGGSYLLVLVYESNKVRNATGVESF